MGSLAHRILLVSCILTALSFEGCTQRTSHEIENTLHLAVDAKIKGLDPIYSNDIYSGVQVSQVYETLYQYHYLKRPYTLVPSLAEGMPEISSDGLIYTIHVKKGVLFQDDPCFQSTAEKGRELTADDVLYSFKRLADPKSLAAGWWILDGKIVGLNEWREAAVASGNTDYSENIEGLKVVDRYTFQLKLKKKVSQFLSGLALPYSAIVPKEAVEKYGKDFVHHPVGTGPFRLVEYNPSSKIVWEKNPTYRKETYPSDGAPGDQQAGLLADADKPLPLTDRIIMHVFTERQPMWLTFLTGKLDLSAIPKDNYASTISPSKELNSELAKKGMKLTKIAAMDITHVTFNMADPLIGKNKYLRQALSLAYDQETFIELFYNGRAIPAQGPIPPGITGYDEKLKNPYRMYSLGRAKELLAKAGYPLGKGLPPLEYASLADSGGRQMAEYFQKMMKGIGVEVKVSSYSWPQFQEVVKNKKAHVWEESWIADYPDSENFLQLFYSKNTSPGPNDSNYSNLEFDKLYEQLIRLQDGADREKVIRKMVGILIEDCPWIFGSHRLSYVVSQPWLKNYKPNDFDYGRYKYYRVDVKARKQAGS